MARRSHRARAHGEAAPAAHVTSAGPVAPSVRAAGLAAALAAGLALAVYAATLAPSVGLVDSGELTLAASTLGVAHPPGTPLWVLLAHVASLVPLGRVAVRVSAASALFAALAAGTLALVVREALRAPRLDESAGAAAGEGLRGTLAATPLLAAGLVLGFSRTLWSFATLAEVYSLNTLLLALILLLVLRWRNGGADATLHAAAVLFGLALGVHHVSVALSAPALALLVHARGGRPFWRSRTLVACGLLALAAAVLVYATLPWAAARGPVFPWGNPVSLQRLLWHVSGRQYQVFFDLSPGASAREVEALLGILYRQFGPPWLPLTLLAAALGLLELWRRDRSLAAALGAWLGANTLFGVAYVIAEDKDAYYLPSVLALALAAGVGASALVSRAAGRARPLAAAAALLLPAVALAGNWRFADRHRDWIAEDYVTNVLASAAPGGLLLTADWQVYSPLLYFREVEGVRRDVAAVDIQLLRRSWYFGVLRRQHPALVAAFQAEADAFLEDLTAWELDPGRYARSPDLTRRINERYLALVQALVERHPGPVYATRDVVLPPGPDPDVAKLLTGLRGLVPNGLVFELRRERATPLPAPLPLRERGLFDGSRAFAPDDVVVLKVRPVYLGMRVARGLYLAALGEHAAAIAAFDEALALDPSFDSARAARERSRAALAAAQRAGGG